MAYKQYTLYGYVSTGMILVNIFHLIYVFDGQYNEKSILSTMDITTEVFCVFITLFNMNTDTYLQKGFGFMLSFGDLTWVPLVYTTQARYMVTHPETLSVPMVLNFLQSSPLYLFELFIYMSSFRRFALFFCLSLVVFISSEDPTDKRIYIVEILTTLMLNT